MSLAPKLDRPAASMMSVAYWLGDWSELASKAHKIYYANAVHHPRAIDGRAKAALNAAPAASRCDRRSRPA